MYFSEFCDIHGRKQIVFNQISDTQIKLIYQAFHRIQQFLNETDHYLNVLVNAQYFLQLSQKGNSKEEIAFVELNLHFTNYLNAFYTWKCFHNHEESLYYAYIYKNLKKTYQDNNLIYCLASDLRNYTTHNGFAVDKIVFDVLSEQVSYWITTDFYLHAEKSKKTSRTVKNTLSTIHSDGIEAVKFTTDFISMFKQLQKSVWEIAWTEIHKEVEIILKITAPDAPDCYNTYIKNSCDDTFHFHVGRILELYYKRMCFLQSFQ